jgi:N-acyl-D-amino-acid deacylase
MQQAAGLSSASERPAPDIVFRDITVVDGTGRPRFRADVAVQGDRIAGIEAPNTLAGQETVDASGRVLAPGFIDIHSHADYTLLIDGRAQSCILQGVTSVAPGNCGHGVAPVTEGSRRLVPMNIPGWLAADELPTRWTSFGNYVDLLRQRGVAVNVFPFVAHGALRLAVAGFEHRELTSQEIATMRTMAAEAMAAGAVGLSTGLEYAPGIASTSPEITRVAEPVGEHSGLYATHCRNRAEAMVQAAEEAVTIAERSGCRLQLSHFVRRPWAPAGVPSRAMDVVRQAMVRGLSARFDVFPFDYGPTGLAFLLPPWARQGTREEIAARLADPTMQRAILNDLAPRFVETLEGGIADSMYVATDAKDGELVGQTLGEVARRRGQSVSEAGLWILARAGIDFYSATIVERWADWSDLIAVLTDPEFLIMGDGASGGLDGPLAGYAFSLSDWGYATEYLGRFVRDQKLVSLEAAVARMTAQPAEQLGIGDRGRIERGWHADLVVFDPASIGSRITPGQLIAPPSGVDHVMVNGRFVVRSGKPIDARPGVVGRA